MEIKNKIIPIKNKPKQNKLDNFLINKALYKSPFIELKEVKSKNPINEPLVWSVVNIPHIVIKMQHTQYSEFLRYFNIN